MFLLRGLFDQWPSDVVDILDVATLPFGISRLLFTSPRPSGAGSCWRSGSAIRELEVLLLVARAMSNSPKASNLHISEATIKSQPTNIYAKRGVASRADSAKKY